MGITRFKTLDGARGVAAILVVLFHVAKVYDVLSPKSAYLAVDMFFALSGFVLARTYEPRFENGLTAYAFMKARALRLYPLYFFGLLLGLIDLTLMWRDRSIDVTTLTVSSLCGAFLLPAYVPFDPRRLFPSNGPGWSLCFEFWIANLGYALLWRFINPKRLGAVLFLSGAALFAFALRRHQMDMGSVWDTLPGGICRVVFSFTAGVAIWRYYQSNPPRIQVPSAAILLTLVLLLCMPSLGRLRPIYDLACVLLAFPAIIYFGAGAKERRPELGGLAGDMSYAVYVLHAPLLSLIVRWQPTSSPAKDFIIALLFTVIVMILALGAHRLDRAIRRSERAVRRRDATSCHF